MEIDPKTGKIIGMPEEWANNPVIINYKHIFIL